MNGGCSFPVSLLGERRLDHNRTAILYASLAFAGALVLWPLYYALTCWFWLLSTAAAGHFESGLPPKFDFWFAVSGAGLLGVRCMAGPWLHTGRWGRKILGPHLFAQLLLLPATFTLEIVANLRGLVFFTAREEQTALILLKAIWQVGRLPATQVGSLTLNRAEQRRVLLRLLLLGLLEVRQEEGVGSVYRRPQAYVAMGPRTQFTVPEAIRTVRSPSRNNLPNGRPPIQ